MKRDWIRIVSIVLIVAAIAAAFGPTLWVRSVWAFSVEESILEIPAEGRGIVLLLLAAQLILLCPRMTATDILAAFAGADAVSVTLFSPRIHIIIKSLFSGMGSYNCTRNARGWAALIVSAIALALNITLLVQRLVRHRHAKMP